MPKDNINRAINKSGQMQTQSFSNLRYEGFGPFNVALVIETQQIIKIDLHLQ